MVHACLHPDRLAALLCGVAFLSLAACGEPVDGDVDVLDEDDIATATHAVCNQVQLTSTPPGPMPPSSSVLLTASGVSCAAGQTPEYRFLYRRVGSGSGYAQLRGWSTDPTATFGNAGRPSGQYRLQVRTRNVGSARPYDSAATLTIMSGNVCPGVTLAASPAAPQLPGTRVALTAAATCTQGPAEYRFLYRRPGESLLRSLRGWGGPTFSWNTTGRAIGEHELVVRSRAAGNPSYESSASIPYVLSDRCTVATVVASPPSPQPAGAGVTITATASCAGGGVPQLRTVFRRAGATTWTELQPWGTGASAVWATAGLAPGDYDLAVEARAPGFSGDGQDRRTVSYRLGIPDRPPTITSDGGGPVAYLSVYENMPPRVTTVVATDPDPGDTVTYGISGGSDAAQFTIQPWGDVAFLGGPRDHENPTDSNLDNVYEVEVAASDGTLVDTQRLVITVTDVPEDPISVAIPENTTEVTTVVPRHPALQPPLSFSITGGADAGLFTVDGVSGRLSFVQPPDHEWPRNASWPIFSNLYRVEVGVTNGSIAETQPYFVAVTDVFEPFLVSVPENRVFVATIPVPTREGGCFGGVCPRFYGIAGGSDAQHFEIDWQTGGLSFAIPVPDYEQPADGNGDNVYEVVVRKGYFNGLQLTDADQVVYVTVTDESDFPFGLVAAENRSTPIVIPFAATVPPYSVQILNGVDRQEFTVDPQGNQVELSFVAPPDFERPQDSDRNNRYDVTIAVTSDVTLVTNVLSVSIFVDDVDEAPVFSSAERASVPENTAAVMNVTATDPEGAPVNYSIAGGADASLFLLDPATGALLFRVAPDFEAPADADGDNLYVVIVQASDGQNASTMGVGVRVSDAFEGDVTASPPLLLPSGPSVVSRSENTDIPLGLHAELTDTDGSESLTVTIAAQFGDPLPGATITDGVNVHTFGSDPSAIVDVSTWNLGAIVARQAPDVDADLLFLVTARSTESNGGATSAVSAYLTARFYTLGTGVALHALTDSLCQLGPGVCLRGPEDDLDGDGFIDSTEFGRTVSGGGDFNGDGFPDFVVGASGASLGGGASPYAGAVYLVLGGPGGVLSNTSVTALNGQNGFRLDGGHALDNLGRKVDLSGDLDGDGFDDLIVSGQGRLHILYGHAGPFPPAMSAAASVELYQGLFAIGVPVATADVNGDGLDDLIEGYIDPASGESAVGAHVVYGRATRLAGPVDWAAIDGTTQSVLVGAPQLLPGGAAVASGGDVNGDGIEDVLIGIAPQGEYGPGTVHVVFGNAAGFGARLDLATVDGTDGFSITSSNALEIAGLGTTLGAAGDVNGDGYDDIVVGAPRGIAEQDPFAGVSYVIFGRGGSFPATLDLAQLTPAQGFRIGGAEAHDGAGYAVSGAGDLNGDGLGDVAVGALRAAGFGYRPNFVPGDTYVIFGRDTGFPGIFDLASLPADAGARLEGGYSIVALSPAGDSDGDGVDELVIGAPDIGTPGAGGVNGLVYRVGGDLLGGPQPRGVIPGTPGDDLVNFATTLPELIQTLGGNDTIDGGGGDDVILAGSGDDTVMYHPGARRISGGPGFDTLAVAGDLDLTDPAVGRRHHLLSGIEQLDLRDQDASTLTLDLLAVIRLSDERVAPIGRAHGLLVLGEATDTLLLGTGWTAAGTAQRAGTTFDVFRASAGNAEVWVDQAIGQVAL